MNEEPGRLWLQRVLDTWEQAIWLNPVPEEHWRYTHSTQMLHEQMAGRMFPLTLGGIEAGIKSLSK